MKRHFLEFEKPIAELTNKIDELRKMDSESSMDIEEATSFIVSVGVDYNKASEAKQLP